MPLIMITGYPSSGKTQRAKALKEQLEQKMADSSGHNNITKVELINDEILNIPKESYRNAQSEKSLRGAQMSAVKRSLDKSTIVIFDNLTYIKGFRYQLFCEAKALMTNSCVVHVGAPKQKCKEWNLQREDKWQDDLFEALVFRYEEPNGMSRWDAPLFIVAHEDTELPIGEIWDTLVLRKPKPPNQATLLKAATPTNYITELDKITMQVINEILSLHKTNPGGVVKLLDYPEPVELPLKLTVAQINRIRRSFISLNKMKPIDMPRIQPMFIEYLVKNWHTES